MNGFENEKEYNAVFDAVKDTISDFYPNFEYFAVRYENDGICVYMDDFLVVLDPDGGHIVGYHPAGEPIPMGADICGAVWFLCLGAKRIYRLFWEVVENAQK